MTYLRIRNWERYQNADVFKKSNGRPPWVKLFIRRDLELDACCIEARLLFIELLKVAGEYANVMSNDLNWISRETRLPLNVVSKGLPVLRRGAWLSETKSPRRSRIVLEKLATREEKRRIESTTASPLKLLVNQCAECLIGGGSHTADCSRRKTA